MDNVTVRFVAGFGPIVEDYETSRHLYGQLLDIPFEEEENGYLHTRQLSGVNHFALWSLSQAAQSCFGTDDWPNDVQTPQAWIEFEVEDIETATAAVESDKYRLFVAASEEPWGQTVTRFLGPDGTLVGLSHTPWMRDEDESSTS